MEAIAGEELDRRIERTVLFRESGEPVPRFSSDDGAATQLALDVARKTGWDFEISRRGGLWCVSWVENRRREPGDARRRKIGALVTATAPTRPLAICRALLKAARLPRWPLAPSRALPRARTGLRPAASLAS